MDEKSVDELLEAELKSELEELKKMEDGSKDKESAVDNIAKLYHAKVEKEKAEAEISEKENRLKDDRKETEFQNQLSLKDRKTKLGIAIAELVGSFGLFMLGMNFEKHNTFCSTMFKEGRNWIQKKLNQK